MKNIMFILSILTLINVGSGNCQVVVNITYNGPNKARYYRLYNFVSKNHLLYWTYNHLKNASESNKLQSSFDWSRQYSETADALCDLGQSYDITFTPADKLMDGINMSDKYNFYIFKISPNKKIVVNNGDKYTIDNSHVIPNKYQYLENDLASTGIIADFNSSSTEFLSGQVILADWSEKFFRDGLSKAAIQKYISVVYYNYCPEKIKIELFDNRAKVTFFSKVNEKVYTISIIKKGLKYDVGIRGR